MQKNTSTIIIILLVIILSLLLYNTFSHKRSIPEQPQYTEITNTTSEPSPQKAENMHQSIDRLTSEEVVVPYVMQHGKLPDYYITKNKAREQGWIPSKGNLCEVLPGRAIGGDIFTNRERNLPAEKGRIWYEADLNYNCGNRNADRLLFSNDGLVFTTHDHYKTFEKQ